MPILRLHLYNNLNVLSMVIVAAVILALFGISEMLRQLSNWPAERTRKLVHIIAGLVALSFPYLFSSPASVLILSATFLLFILLSLKFGLLNSVNAIPRRSFGSIVYPLIISICFVVYAWQGLLIYYYLPLLIFIICDPLAAFVGMRRPWKPFRVGKDVKTVSGSISFLLGSFPLILWQLYLFTNIPTSRNILYSGILALSTTLAEAVSPWGLDNLSVPLTAISLLYLLNV